MTSNKLRILVVDDEPILAMTTVDMLTELGFEAVEAYSGLEGLSIIESEPTFDLIITDHRMPEMSGPEFAAHVRAKVPNMPILIVSGYAAAPTNDIAALPLLSKPFSLAELEAEIKKLTTMECKSEMRPQGN